MSDQQQNGHGEPGSERELAVRRHVLALGTLDTAAEPSPAVGASAAAAAADVARLNALWNQYAPESGDQSPKSWIRRAIAELARLLPWRRRRVHGAMIAAINRNVETTRALIDATQNFQAHVVWYAQTVAGLAAGPRGPLANAEGVEALQRALRVLSSDWLMHWESLAAREQRYDARMTSLTQAYDNVLEVASLAQRSTMTLKRAVDAIAAGQPAVAAAPASSAAAGASPAPASPADVPDTNAFKYVEFEDRYRGSREDIQRRLAEYVPLFDGASQVLDVGCGRGELLGLLRDRGIEARGIDINDEMVATCRARGLTADRADALAFLSAQPDGSLGGLIAIQVVEHLEPGYLMRLIDTAYQKLKPGAPLVLETINAACWAAFFDSYIRDFTHARPLHPDTLRYLVQASGFAKVDIRYLSPIAPHDKLALVKLVSERDATPTVLELVEGLNDHANRLNSQLFTYRDYAVIARR
jgi:SAM-dependent methyltransferase